MTAPETEESVYALATLMLGCLSEALSTSARPPKTVSLRPGGRVELLMSKLRDECCEGLGWVRVASTYPSTNFPNPDGDYQPCGPIQKAAVLELGVARCAPIGTVSALPTAAQWTAVTAATLADEAAMDQAVCCFTTLQQDRMYVVGAWEPLTVEGGCVGSTMTLTIAVAMPDCEG